MNKTKDIAGGTETTDKPHDGNRKVQPLVQRILLDIAFLIIGKYYRPDPEKFAETSFWHDRVNEAYENFNKAYERGDSEAMTLYKNQMELARNRFLEAAERIRLNVKREPRCT
ncbi:hypothetical protein P4C99_21890 [Pontiellaceae bacterium B1224]|nr:hypothetical protein [Pontiellaceae bacterium B1224]